MDNDRQRLSTSQKALKINLDPIRYGAFAEIGAGQEVARWFFKVGAAAGTISKSMSAYDMAVSDAIYGRCKRYVSRERIKDHDTTWEDMVPLRIAELIKERGFFGYCEDEILAL